MKIELNKKAKSAIAVFAIIAFVYAFCFIIIPFPKNAIVVSVIRNGKYIIPTEDFKIKYSDQIQVLTDSNDYPFVREEIEELFGD